MFPVVFAKRARREQGVMGREKRRKSLSLAFLLPITPRAPLERDRERRLGTSQIQNSLELWIPCCGFRTSGTGLRISWQWNLDYRFQSLVGFRIPQAKISRIPETGLSSILLTRRKIGLSVNLQSWTKVLGTVLQYSYFSVISRFPLKTVHPFRNFLAVLPPPTLYKVETQKKILDTRVQHCLWGEGRGWTCVNWKTPQKLKRVPRFLSMIVVPIIQTSRQIRIYNSYKLKGFPRFACAVVISVFVCLVWSKSQEEIKVNLCKITEFLFWFSDSSRALWESGDLSRSGGSKSLH